MTLAARKARAREAAFAARKAAFAGGQGDAAARLSDLLQRCGDGILAGYMPMRTEIDPLPAMESHPGAVCVPVIQGAGLPLRFSRRSAQTPMVPGPFGARVPARDDWLVPDILIVPLLAWDRRGFRLGYGGGYYDRTLEGLRRLRPTLAIGFAFAQQEVDEVPVEATDQPLDWLVTQTEVLKFA